jgi:hypothetical protein
MIASRIVQVRKFDARTSKMAPRQKSLPSRFHRPINSGPVTYYDSINGWEDPGAGSHINATALNNILDRATYANGTPQTSTSGQADTVNSMYGFDLTDKPDLNTNLLTAQTSKVDGTFSPPVKATGILNATPDSNHLAFVIIDLGAGGTPFGGAGLPFSATDLQITFGATAPSQFWYDTSNTESGWSMISPTTTVGSQPTFDVHVNSSTMGRYVVVYFRTNTAANIVISRLRILGTSHE